jgi:hypothetical protein
VHFPTSLVAMKTVHKMALMAASCAALTAFATSRVSVETGLGHVLAVAVAITGLLCTLMFGAAYVKLRKR